MRLPFLHGWSILKHGVEISKSRTALWQVNHGVPVHVLAGTHGKLVAYPPLGKAMIAVGGWLFGLTSFGWRFSVAVVGSLAVLLVCRNMRRMTGSTLPRLPGPFLPEPFCPETGGPHGCGRTRVTHFN